MWSKRRKKFARTYDTDKHRLYLFTLWFQREMSERLAAAIDQAILFGIKDESSQKDISYGISIAKEIIRKCF